MYQVLSWLLLWSLLQGLSSWLSQVLAWALLQVLGVGIVTGIVVVVVTGTVVVVVDVLMAKLAVTEILAMTFVSVRAAAVTLSLQLTKWYPVSGTAVTFAPAVP